jgi:Domain of unknown function (DUF4142)
MAAGSTDSTPMKTPHFPHARRIASVAAALVALASPVFAQQPAAAPAASAPLSPAAKPKPLDSTEKKFVKDFVEQHLFEQELTLRVRGKQNKAQREKKPSPLSPAMSDLYKKVSGDLTASWTEFATLTQSRDLEITTTPKAADKAASDRIGKLEGEKFEKELVKALGKEAKKTVTILTTAAKSVRDPEIKAFIDKWSPAFTAHVAAVESAETAIKGR